MELSYEVSWNLDLVFGDVSPYNKFILNIWKQKDAYIN